MYIAPFYELWVAKLKRILARLIRSYYDHIFEFLFERVCNVAVCGRLNVNVALNRPTFMVSTYNSSSYGRYLASRAVDGNADPLGAKVDNSCCLSNMHDDPWWAVDLGAALVVFGVLFTNRADNWGKAIGYIVASKTRRPRGSRSHGHRTLQGTQMCTKLTSFI